MFIIYKTKTSFIVYHTKLYVAKNSTYQIHGKTIVLDNILFSQKVQKNLFEIFVLSLRMSDVYGNTQKGLITIIILGISYWKPGFGCRKVPKRSSASPIPFKFSLLSFLIPNGDRHREKTVSVPFLLCRTNYHLKATPNKHDCVRDGERQQNWLDKVRLICGSLEYVNTN